MFIGIAVGFLFAKNSVKAIIAEKDVQILLITIFTILVLIGVNFIFAFFAKISVKMSVVICMFLAGNMLWTLNKSAPYYQDVKKPSTRKIAKFIRMNKSNDDLVFCYNMYYQDFPVYLNDTTGVVNFVGELEFGAKAEPQKSKLISEEKFWELWNTTNKRIFLVLSRSNYREVFAKRTNFHNMLVFDKNFVAISNK